VFLLGRTMGGTHLVFNLGGLVDPGEEVSRKRPIGFELGVDLDQDLDKDGIFSILGEVGWVHYVSGDPEELAGTLGLQLSPNEKLDLSVSGLLGLSPGSDRYGVLFGVSPKLRLF
jgi:hypothetical protein